MLYYLQAERLYFSVVPTMANTGFTKDDVLARKSATDKNESLLEPENKGFTSLVQD